MLKLENVNKSPRARICVHSSSFIKCPYDELWKNDRGAVFSCLGFGAYFFPVLCSPIRQLYFHEGLLCY